MISYIYLRHEMHILYISLLRQILPQPPRMRVPGEKRLNRCQQIARRGRTTPNFGWLSARLISRLYGKILAGSTAAFRDWRLIFYLAFSLPYIDAPWCRIIFYAIASYQPLSRFQLPLPPLKLPERIFLDIESFVSLTYYIYFWRVRLFVSWWAEWLSIAEYHLIA